MAGQVDGKLLGLTVDRWAQLISSVGVPTIFMGFIMWLAYVNVPPVVQAHVELLRRTGDTLESMDQTLQQSNAAIEEIVEVQRQTKTFMTRVCEDHDQHTEKLNEVLQKVSK